MSKFVRKTKGQLEVKCSTCSRSFFVYKAQRINRPHGNFCDKDCLGLYRSNHLISEKAANYKTGARENNGYIEVEARWHPSKSKKGYVSLHRLIAEARAGRFLNPGEIVHHVDHDKKNNHWNNLQIMTQSAHARIHLKQCAKTGRLTS